jgi:hypothetical protein
LVDEEPPSLWLGGFFLFTCRACVYNINMEDVLFYATLSIVFVTLVSAVGGFFAYALDSYDSRTKPKLAWASHHAPSRSKEGGVTARHESCVTCELAVVHSGGQLVGLSHKR